MVINPRTNPGLRFLNPIAKDADLGREDGTALYDSPVIIEYLNHTRTHIVPTPSTCTTDLFKKG